MTDIKDYQASVSMYESYKILWKLQTIIECTIFCVNQISKKTRRMKGEKIGANKKVMEQINLFLTDFLALDNNSCLSVKLAICRM